MIGVPSRPLKLLPESALLRSSPVDHPDWNYRPLLGTVQRLRFQIVLEILGDRRYDRLLEIGYGSGVFMPELAGRCDEIYGIDPNSRPREVAENLARHGVKADLTRTGAESLPYEDGYFDCVVAVSSLEFVPDIEAACREIRRVLRPGGTLAVVTPGDTPLWDLALRVATRESPSIFADRRQRLQPALRSHFRLAREVRIPRLAWKAVRLYTGLHLRTD